MKKIIGYIVAILIVGTMVVLMINNYTSKKVVTSADGVEEGPGAIQSEDEIKQSEGLGQGDIPPNFELTTLDGETYTLADLKGKKIILNFWASWCGPCKAEMPHMQNYYETYAEEDNVEIIAVNLTTQERRGLDGIKEFIDSYGLTFPIPLDDTGSAGSDYRVISIPTTYLLNTDGTLGQKVIGPMDEKTIRMLVDHLY